MAPNDGHPLAGVEPEERNSQRQNMIAEILARLAGSDAGNSGKEDTISIGLSTVQPTYEDVTEIDIISASENDGSEKADN